MALITYRFAINKGGVIMQQAGLAHSTKYVFVKINKWLLEKKKMNQQQNNIYCCPLRHILPGLEASLFGNQLIWSQVRLENSLKWSTGESRLRLFELFLQKSRRCAIDSVIVTIHCNNRWNDNIFFSTCHEKVKVLAAAEKICLQIIKTAGEVLNSASFVARCTWHFFFHPFFLFFLTCTKLCVQDRSGVETLPAATDCLSLL